MHEFSLAQNMATLISEKAEGRKVTTVDIEVGALSGAVPEALEFCTQIVFEEAFGKGVSIHILPRPAEALCRCGNQFIMETPMSPCPVCAGFYHDITAGKDVFVKSFEVDAETAS